MRLIDADGIKFEEDCTFSGKVLNDFIKAIPTAYDVDKVVGNLRKLNGNEFTYARVMHIVKEGGVNE